ncbi:MAG: 2'-5' RNA ligase family protein [Flammeovirgaceae bacterium]|nr:2'-5' RNA ligase family protein [Flammeovirgaceae bacterium]
MKGLYFIALIPPEPLFTEAMNLKVYFRDHFESKASLNSPPHITLHMPFQWRAEKEGMLSEQLSLFSAQQEPFEVEFNNFSSFAPRVVFIDVKKSDKLHDLQKSLLRFCKQELNLFNANYKDLPFHPHLTLAFRDLKKLAYSKAWEEFADKKFEGKFTVDKMSLLKHNGKVWKVLKEFNMAENHLHVL